MESTIEDKNEKKDNSGNKIELKKNISKELFVNDFQKNWIKIRFKKTKFFFHRYSNRRATDD